MQNCQWNTGDVFFRNNMLEKVDVSEWAGNDTDHGLSTTLVKLSELLRGLYLMTPSNWNGTRQCRLYTGELPGENVFQLGFMGNQDQNLHGTQAICSLCLDYSSGVYQKTVAMGQTNAAKSNFFPMTFNMSLSASRSATSSSLGRPVFIISRSLATVT